MTGGAAPFRAADVVAIAIAVASVAYLALGPASGLGGSSAGGASPPELKSIANPDGTLKAQVDATDWRDYCRHADLPDPPDLNETDPVTATIVMESVQEWISTGSADTVGKLGQVYIALEEHEAAAECFAGALELGREKSKWAYFLGAELQSLGRVDDALAAFKAVVQSDPGYPTTYARLGQLYLERGELDLAAAAHEAFIARRPTESLGYVGLGRVALARGDGPAAIEHLNTAIKHSPQDYMAYRLLSRAYGMVGDAQNARKFSQIAETLPEYRGWLTFDPRLWDCHRLANTQRYLTHEFQTALGRRDLDRAVQIGESIIARRPQDASLLATLAQLYHHLGQAPKARQASARAAELRPDIAAIMLTRAEIAFVQGEHAAARQAVDAVLASEPRSDRALQILGRLLFVEGRQDEGIRAVREALQINPASPDGRVVYINMLKSTGLIEEAREALKVWLAQNPNDEWARKQQESIAQPPD